MTWSHFRWVLLLLIMALFIGLTALLFSGRFFLPRSEPLPLPTESLPVSQLPEIVTVTPLPVVSPSPLPPKVTLDVPFLVQAPLAVWDELHEEACEEASLIMVNFYHTGKTIASREAGEKEITDLVAYETENGYAVDVTVEELAVIAKSYYGLSTGRVENNITVDDIKRELSAGRPVIVPAAGKILPNPYFTAGGPNYHMLVITGYDADGFITNDPGTRRGQNFRYAYNDLMNAIHDWNGGHNILDGPKQYLVFD
jgi:uncharacterized protein YvpB